MNAETSLLTIYSQKPNGGKSLKKEPRHINSAFIKHQIHKSKIDEFFWTDAEAPHKRFSPLALIGSAAGVFTPLIFFAKKQNPGLKLNTTKNILKSLNVNYGLKELLTVGLGGVFGGLAGGLADRKEKNKLAKIQEATFQLMNVSFPALFVTGAIKLCEKNKNLNNAATKLLGSALGMLAGANLAIGLTNKIDNKIFDKHNVAPDREFKKKDFIIHIDDLVGSLMLAKVPLADKLQMNKILPLIFTWSGFHVGEK